MASMAAFLIAVHVSGCAGNGVNVEVLGLDDLRGPHLGCKAANANGLVVGKHAQVRDGAARHGGFDVDVILVAQPWR